MLRDHRTSLPPLPSRRKYPPDTASDICPCPYWIHSFPAVALFRHCLLANFESLCMARKFPVSDPKRCVCFLQSCYSVAASACGKSRADDQRTLASGVVCLTSARFSAGFPPAGDGAQALLDFKDSDIKFSLRSLMDILRDHQHEGWVLAAYPDPNTRRPLIGAGFSLDVQATEHPQRDPLNPHPFVEPSSAQLWQAAGLAPERLQQILDQFDHDSTDGRRNSIAARSSGTHLRRS